MQLDVKVDIQPNLEEEIRSELVNMLKIVMMKMEADAVRIVPVDTGTLKNSIHLEEVSEFEIILADGVEYGVYVEYGTVKQRAQPFFRPALDIAISDTIPNMKINLFT